MADILVNQMIDNLAQYAFGAAPARPSLTYHLFVNNVTITSATLLANLTECTAPGYAAINVPYTSWSGATAAGVANYSAPNITFSLTGQGAPAQTVYGHYVTDQTSGVLLFGLTWAAPWAIPSGGGPVLITPKWTTQQCP